MFARMLWMRVERVLETTHVIVERRERRVHTAGADAGDHTRAVHGFQILAQQMQRNIDILMHHIGLVSAHFVRNFAPS